MVLNDKVIQDIKDKSNLLFDKAADFLLLADRISHETGRTIGQTTLKRLFGYIDDDRKTNIYTLNTLALYLGYSTWDEYFSQKNLESEWNFPAKRIIISEQSIETKIQVKYLNRKVTFKVAVYKGQKVLQVLESENSSLKLDDIVVIHSLELGKIIEADQVIRNGLIGNYRTHGEISDLTIV